MAEPVNRQSIKIMLKTLRLAPSVAVFKKKLLSIVRPPAKSVFGIHDVIGLPNLTQLRVGLGKFNFHAIQALF